MHTKKPRYKKRKNKKKYKKFIKYLRFANVCHIYYLGSCPEIGLNQF